MKIFRCIKKTPLAWLLWHFYSLCFTSCGFGEVVVSEEICIDKNDWEEVSKYYSEWIGIQIKEFGPVRDRLDEPRIFLQDYRGKRILLYGFDSGDFVDPPRDEEVLLEELRSLSRIREKAGDGLVVIGFTYGTISFLPLEKMPTELHPLVEFPIVNLNKIGSYLPQPFRLLCAPGSIVIDCNGIITDIFIQPMTEELFQKVASGKEWAGKANPVPTLNPPEPGKFIDSERRMCSLFIYFQDLPAGTVFKDEYVRLSTVRFEKDMPEDRVEKPRDFEGRILTVPVRKGDPVRRSHFGIEKKGQEEQHVTIGKEKKEPQNSKIENEISSLKEVAPIPTNTVAEELSMTQVTLPPVRKQETGKLPQEFTNSIGMKFVIIRAGEFLMGSPSDEEKRNNDETHHKVTITKDFYLQTTEVTQAQYEKIIGANPSNWKGGDLPVEQVSWHDAVEFCKSLSQKGGKEYRLPTETEWEYACRAGTITPFYFGETISTDQANHDGSIYGVGRRGMYREKTIEVGNFPANAWGLYDMHGNVWEWCNDWYADYPSGSVTDPKGPESGLHKVVRGGSWDNKPEYARSAYRLSWLKPAHRVIDVGFRCAMTP